MSAHKTEVFFLEIHKILEKLGSFSPKAVAEVKEPTYIQTHKMIKPGQPSFFPACLYVGYVSELPPALEDMGKANLICIDDAPIPSGFTESGDINLYLIPKGTNQFDVLNKIADIMIDEATLTSAMRRILDALYSGNGLQALVDVASEVFENPIFINDSAYKIIAMSHKTQFKNETLEEEKSLGYVHVSNIEGMKRDGLLSKFLGKSDKIITSKRRDKNETWLFKNVLLHGIFIAAIAIVDNNRPFRELDYELLERFSKIVAVEMEKNDFYKDNRGVMYNYFLSDLISGKIQNQKSITQRANILNWKMYEWFKIIVIVDGKKEFSESRMQSIADNIRRAIPDCRWTIYQKNLIVFISRPKKDIASESEIETFKIFLKNNDIYAGVSSSFNNLMEASRYYKQAVRAVDVGVFSHKSEHLFFYPDISPYYAASLILKRSEPRDFCPDEIEIVQRYDAENNSELLLTLEKYLYYVDDPVSAAKSLNIHRNTLLYRINKIKELTGLDLSYGDERFKVQLYLKLAQYHKNTN